MSNKTKTTCVLVLVLNEQTQEFNERILKKFCGQERNVDVRDVVEQDELDDVSKFIKNNTDSLSNLTDVN